MTLEHVNNKLYIYTENIDHRTCFIQPSISFMELLGWIVIKSENFDWMKFEDYVLKNNVKNIFIMFDYEELIKNHAQFLENNKINLLIFVNDLHLVKNRPENEEKIKLNKLVEKFKNIYYCASYWYCLQNFFNVSNNRSIKFPIGIAYKNTFNLNNSTINKVLLSGSCTSSYPARKFMIKLQEKNLNIDRLKQSANVIGDDYLNYLKRYLCCFTCCSYSYTPYIVSKFFEIPSVGSLLLAYDVHVKDQLKELGFIDGENYISCDLTNMNDKINYIVDPKNRNEIDKIRKNGYDMIWKNHTLIERMKDLTKYIDNNLEQD